MPGAVWSNDSFSDGNPSKTKRRSAYDADQLEEMQRKQISVTLFHCAEISALVSFDGEGFKGDIGPWTVLIHSSVSCQCPPLWVITLASCFKP